MTGAEQWPPTVQGDPDDVAAAYLERKPFPTMTLDQARLHQGGAIAGYVSHPLATPELVTVDAVSGPLVLGSFVGDGQPFAVWPDQLVAFPTCCG